MNTPDDRHSIATARASATILAQGAELCRLQDGAGLDYLWDAGPAWPRHAPVLFPTIGRLTDDTLTVDGRRHPMGQHGFARDRRFTWVERTPTACTLVLTNDAETEARYPFPFRFGLQYALDGATLHITYTVQNTGSAIMPASMGAHPAFRWPIRPGTPKEAYRLEFEHPEPAPIRAVSGGLLTPDLIPSPLHGNVLPLSDALFANDALIFPAPHSRSVRLTAAGAPGLTVAWQGFPQLGVWMKPGADFLCIEPWAGMASPHGFDGEARDKPWMMLIEPGTSQTARYSVTLEP